MGRSEQTEAVILRAFDVGEADRFLVLLTRERGRLTARAAGARKPGSRMGGALLAFSHVDVLLKETAAGWIVGSARRLDDPPPADLHSFSQTHQAVELLLRLTQDGQPLPEIFTLLLRFLATCRAGLRDASDRFGFALLHLLGFLPEYAACSELLSLSTEDRDFLTTIVRHSNSEALWTSATECSPKTRQLFGLLLKNHLHAPLRAGMVGEALTARA